MFLLKKLLSALALPPLSLILLALLGLLLTRRHPRTGRWLAGLSLLSLAMLSVPAVSIALMRSLETHPPIQAAQLARVQAIVVLGGGIYYSAPEYGGDTVGRHSLERIRYAAHLHKKSGLPILVSGGAPFGGRPEAETMQEALERDFSSKVRWTEKRSNDTAENASLSGATLWAAKVTRIALVSHAWHLPRAIALFEKQGLEVIAAPTAFTPWPPMSAALFLPSADALARSNMALHEWLGILMQRAGR